MPASQSHITTPGVAVDSTDRFERGGNGYANGSVQQQSSSSRRYVSSRRNSMSALPRDSKHNHHYENDELIRSASGSHLVASTDLRTDRPDTETFYRNSENRYKSMPISQGRKASSLATSAALTRSGYVPNGIAYPHDDHYDQRQAEIAESNFVRNDRHRKSVLRSIRKWMKKQFKTSKSAPDGFNDDGGSNHYKKRSSSQYTAAYPQRPWERSERNERNERTERTDPSYYPPQEPQPPPLPRHQTLPHNSRLQEQYPSSNSNHFNEQPPQLISSRLPPVPILIASGPHPEASCNTDAAHYSPDEQDSGVETPSSSEKPVAQLRDLPTPCVSGIKNLGNTCYINAVLQCLSATDLLAEYLVTERYARDLEDQTHAQQKISRQFGTNGAATRSLATYLQRLWFNRYDESVSRDFKALLGQFSADYRTSSQQDAQEFLVWLLDKVHEDLNTATKRTYRQMSGKIKGSEEDLAAEAFDMHRSAHCSHVTDLFSAQFRSSVWCPDCHKTKLNFDPYMCVSLPVPQDTKKPLFVTMVFWNRRPRLLKLGLNADATAKLIDVKNCLKQAANVNPHEIVMCDLSESGFRCVYPDATDVITLGSIDKAIIYAIETPPMSSPPSLNSDRIPSSTYESSRSTPDDIIVLFCNTIGNEARSSRRGYPFSLRIDREVNYELLCRRMLAMARPLLRKNIDVLDVPFSAFRVRVADEYAAGVYLDGGVTMPLYTQDVDNALNYGNRAYAGPPTLRLVLEWDVSTQHLYLDDGNEPVLDHQSCADLLEEMKAPAATLMQCLKEYTQTETLEEWRCDSCKRKQRRAEKSLKFRSVPDVLVIHLKRFKHQPDGETIKLDPTVQFPIDSLDLSVFMYHSGTTPVPHRKANGVYQQNRPAAYQSARGNSHGGWQGRKRAPSGGASGRQPDQSVPPGGALYVNTEQNQNLYDLFAVVNHKGESINSGHYTAFCRNPVDGQWRLFDDTYVQKVEAKQVISNNAYLLFYERRGASRAANCRNSSESGFSDHWFYRLPARIVNKYLNQPQVNGAVSSATTPRPSRPETPASTIDDTESTVFCRSEPSRNPHSPTHRPATPTGVKSARSNGDIRKPPVPLPRPSLANPNHGSASLYPQPATSNAWPSSSNDARTLGQLRKEVHIKSCSAIETDL